MKVAKINVRSLKGYYKISRHYKWALTQVFDEMNYQYAVIVEGEREASYILSHVMSCDLPHLPDDLEVAPDFFSYFSALRFLLEEDPSVWCVSAWNDNGKEGYIDTQHNGRQWKAVHSVSTV